METQTNAQQLQEKIKGFLNELARETDLARKSETMQNYLNFVAKFHQYSANNIWLILMTKPDATHVAGFQTWKRMNRWVRKGEKGIPIFAPLVHKEDPDNDLSPKILNGFRIVYVFDVSQTEGDRLPPVPSWKSPEKSTELTEKLIAFARNKGIAVTFKDLSGDIQGVSKGGAVEVDHSAGTKTLIHELGHELLKHHQEEVKVDKASRELQAEAVAFVVSRYFGLDGLQSPNYIALYGLNSEDFVSSVVKIQEIAREIILAVSKQNIIANNDIE